MQSINLGKIEIRSSNSIQPTRSNFRRHSQTYPSQLLLIINNAINIIHLAEEIRCSSEIYDIHTQCYCAQLQMHLCKMRSTMIIVKQVIPEKFHCTSHFVSRLFLCMSHSAFLSFSFILFLHVSFIRN